MLEVGDAERPGVGQARVGRSRYVRCMVKVLFDGVDLDRFHVDV
jgi:hypothetical protein